MKKRYFDVPDLPGVPPLLRDPHKTVGFNPLPVVGTVAGKVIQQVTRYNDWGIYDESGKEAITCDSFISIDFKASEKLPTFPIVDGAFANYNKVKQPYEATVVLSFTDGNAKRLIPNMNPLGADKARAKFLKSIDDIKTSTKFYSVVTPEHTMISANVSGYSYARTSTKNAEMLEVSIQFTEIMTVTAGATTTANAKNVDATNQTAQGKVQPQAASNSATSAAQGALATEIF